MTGAHAMRYRLVLSVRINEPRQMAAYSNTCAIYRISLESSRGLYPFPKWTWPLVHYSSGGRSLVCRRRPFAGNCGVSCYWSSAPGRQWWSRVRRATGIRSQWWSARAKLSTPRHRNLYDRNEYQINELNTWHVGVHCTHCNVKYLAAIHPIQICMSRGVEIMDKSIDRGDECFRNPTINDQNSTTSLYYVWVWYERYM